MLANQASRKPSEPATPATAGAARKEAPGPRVVESRFGTIEMHPDNCFALPHGLLGFAEFHEFGLAALPEGRHPQFRVLQCLEAPELAFLVAPLNIESGAIDAADLDEACTTLNIRRTDLAILLIVTVRRDDEGAHVSVNMRAPLFVDTVKRIARQFVLPNNKYSIRHVL